MNFLDLFKFGLGGEKKEKPAPKFESDLQKVLEKQNKVLEEEKIQGYPSFSGMPITIVKETFGDNRTNNTGPR